MVNGKNTDLFLRDHDVIVKVGTEAEIRNQYHQVPHLIQDTTRESDKSDKNTIKHHTQESQEVNPFPTGDRKAAMNRQESMTKMKHK